MSGDSPRGAGGRLGSVRFGRAGFAVALALALLMSGAVVKAFVHDGKSFAIEAAMEQLGLQQNPFVLRESWWNGELKAGETKIVQHQLFKRNEYWFWLGSSIQESKVSIHIYDAEGKLADAEAWQDKYVAGVRVVPQNTGVYYIRVAIDEAAEEPVEWAVIYGYR